MKQVWPNYSYSPTTNVLTLTGLNIDRDQLLLVTAAERGRIMYNFADSTVTASAFTAGANTGLTLVASTAGLTTTAALVIYYDDQLTSTTVTVSSLPAISGTVTANAGSGFPSVVYSGILQYIDAEGAIAVDINYALPAGTNRIGVVTIGAGTVTIGAGTAQIGSVTASISGTVTAGLSNAVSPSLGTPYGSGDPYPVGAKIIPVGGWTSEVDGAHWQALSLTDGGALYVYGQIAPSTNRIGVVTIGAGTVTIGAGTAQIGSVTASISGTVPISISSVTVGNTVTIAGTVTANPTGTQTIAGTVTIGAGTAQIGSVTASLAISSTAITSGSFTSLTSATLVPGNTARKMATVYNLGAGQLFVNAGATATTLGGGFMVALSSGDYYECGFTTTTLSALYATAGTCSWVSH